MEKNLEFEDIRPLYDDEVELNIKELLSDPQFRKAVKVIIPDEEWHVFETLLNSVKNKKEFQVKISTKVVYKIADKTTDSLSSAGFENLEKGTAYTYVSNHRDIVLDAAFLSVILNSQDFEIAEIAIGDNLLLYPWIEKVVRLNRSFLVKRGLSIRQQLEESTHLSKYIHYTIAQKKESVWIAQREGRAKDSNDKTQESVLKMLAMGGEYNFLDNIKKLNIAPVSLSYQYDSCDYLKAEEFQQRRDNPEYKKSKADDFLNMETGMFGYKGNVVFRFGKPINNYLDKLDTSLPKSEQVALIALLIDKEIYLNYTFFPINYIAYDRLWGNNLFQDKYTEEDINVFDKYLNQQLDKIRLENKDIPYLTQKILEMYANPVRNYLSVEK